MRADAVVELFAPVLPVRTKRMFGGLGVYDGELIFAIVFDGEVYLKTSGQTRSLFAEAGSVPFTYAARSRERETGYWRLPEAAFDDGEELRRWTGLALEAARAAKTLRRRGSSPRASLR
ncbi:TfoX/Sxy family protein [Bosea sp. (in: a-proteobacteria)]|jgi:DNA transformation protein|uniref:TfoX/Sxy family protein n=1 Tax=Bosea sp. (in: a-proteobacteria) TaxID=1871050 RepID=UPI003F70F14C